MYHERACRRQHPYRRGAEHLLLNLFDGLLRSGDGFFMGQRFYRREYFRLRRVVEPAEYQHHADGPCHGRSEEPGLPTRKGDDGAYEKE